MRPNDRIQKAELTMRLKTFAAAAGLREGEFYGMVFQDGDRQNG